MSVVPSVHTPCPVPADFDQDAFHGVSTEISRLHDRAPWRSCVSGLNGVAFRFAAADEAHDRFVAAASGPNAFGVGTPSRYEQEASLFSFFVNTISSIECFYFALYNVGACLKPSMFPAKDEDLRKVSIPETLRRFKTAYAGTPLLKVLLGVRDSKELAALKNHRDVLTHRGTLPRGHDFGVVVRGSVVDARAPLPVTVPSNPKAAPADWRSDVALGPGMTSGAREWLGGRKSKRARVRKGRWPEDCAGDIRRLRRN